MHSKQKEEKGMQELKKGAASPVHPFISEKEKLFQKIHIIGFFFFDVLFAKTGSHGHS